jgi:hypothetical protein
MVMLTLARFVLEKTGGDSMPEVLDNLRRYRARIAATPVAPAAGDGSGGHGSVTGGATGERASDAAGASDASEDA